MPDPDSPPTALAEGSTLAEGGPGRYALSFTDADDLVTIARAGDTTTLPLTVEMWVGLEPRPADLDLRRHVAQFWLGGGDYRTAPFIGRIGELRVSKSARYLSDFTVPPVNVPFAKDKNTLALYHFDEGSGDVLIDSSGNGRDGKIVGAKWVSSNLPPITNLPQRPVLSFNEVDSYVDVASLPMNLSEPFTVEAWCGPFNRRSRPGLHRVILQLGPLNLQICHAELWNITVRKIVDGSHVGTSLGKQDTFYRELWNRTHIVGQWDGDQMQLFVNGRQSKQEPVAFNTEKSVDDLHKELLTSEAATHLRIGRFAKNFDDEPMDYLGGRIDTVRVSKGLQYDDEFVPQELAANEDTIALYRFLEGEGDLLLDSSGNDHHGQIVGAEWILVGQPSIDVELTDADNSSIDSSFAPSLETSPMADAR